MHFSFSNTTQDSRKEHPSPHRRLVEAITVSLLLLCSASSIRAQSDKTVEGPAISKEQTNHQAERTEVTLKVTVTSTLPELSVEETSGATLAERGQSDLAAALRDSSGLSATRRGPINLDPTLRGLQEGQIAITVDGTRTFAAGPARMDSALSHISPHALDRIAVVKGPYALVWGAGALSAIDVRTFRPGFAGQPWSARAGLAGESNSEAVDAFGQIYGSSERLQWSLLYNFREGQDYEDGNGAEIPGDYQSQDIRWQLGLRLSPSSTLEYSGGYQGQDDLDYPGRLLDATFFKTRSHSLRFDWQPTKANSLTSVFAQAYANRKDHLMNNDEKPTGRDMAGRIPPFALDIGIPTESNTSGGRAHAKFATGNWSILAGADHYLSEKTADRFVRRRSNGFLIFEDRVWPDAEISDTGVFGQAVFQAKNLEVGGAIRYDAVETEADPTTFFLANTSGDLDQSEDNISASISARFDVSQNWKLSAGAGRAVRTASVLERYSDRFPSTKFQIAAEFLGNPELDPEASLEFDLGLAHQSESFSFAVDVFYRTIDDYITVIADPSIPKRLPLSPPVVFRYTNGTRAEYHGGELRFTHRVTELFSWRANVDVLRADDKELNEPVLGIPADRLRLVVRLQNRTGNIWGEFEGSFTDDQNRVARTRREQQTASYEVFDLRLGWRIDDAWTLAATVSNLTDEDYANHLNTPNPFTGQRILEAGTAVRVGIRWSL